VTGRLLLLAALALLGAQGCAAVELTLFGVGAGVAGGASVSYTLDSIAYETFTASEEELRAATLEALGKMDMQVKHDVATESGRQIAAQAGDRTVEIELDRITARTSRMRVVGKQGWFFRDRATAGEIIVQTEQTLENEPLLSKSAR
jgi:hypothetical protein